MFLLFLDTNLFNYAKTGPAHSLSPRKKCIIYIMNALYCLVRTIVVFSPFFGPTTPIIADAQKVNLQNYFSCSCILNYSCSVQTLTYVLHHNAKDDFPCYETTYSVQLYLVHEQLLNRGRENCHFCSKMTRRQQRRNRSSSSSRAKKCSSNNSPPTPAETLREYLQARDF